MIDIVFLDESAVVCVKPPEILSTDEAGGLPGLLREQLGGEIFTVHRLDRVVSGLMVLARSKKAASLLSAQITDGRFKKEYLAVIHGSPEAASGTFCDLLLRDRRECKTYVVQAPGKGVREAVLDYQLLAARDGLSLVKIVLKTGRTHQIRAQFSSRGLPLVGDRKYGGPSEGRDIALRSYSLGFESPDTGEALSFTAPPPPLYPWNLFNISFDTAPPAK